MQQITKLLKILVWFGTSDSFMTLSAKQILVNNFSIGICYDKYMFSVLKCRNTQYYILPDVFPVATSD